MSPHRLIRPLAVAAAVFVVTMAADSSRTAAKSSANPAGIPDSITIRLAVKNFNSGRFTACQNQPLWGWDTLTWRARSGDDLPRDSTRRRFLLSESFRLGKIVSRDSAWVLFHGILFTGGGLDSVLAGPAGQERCLEMMDASMCLRIMTVPRWPEPPRKSVATALVIGRVIDDLTLEPVSMASVIVLNSRLITHTTEPGEFALEGVPVGKQTLEACREGYYSRDVEITAPSDVTVRLQRIRR